MRSAMRSRILEMGVMEAISSSEKPQSETQIGVGVDVGGQYIGPLRSIQSCQCGGKRRFSYAAFSCYSNFHTILR